MKFPWFKTRARFKDYTEKVDDTDRVMAWLIRPKTDIRCSSSTLGSSEPSPWSEALDPSLLRLDSDSAHCFSVSTLQDTSVPKRLHNLSFDWDSRMMTMRASPLIQQMAYSFTQAKTTTASETKRVFRITTFK